MAVSSRLNHESYGKILQERRKTVLHQTIPFLAFAMLITTIHHVCSLSRWLIASCVLFIVLQTVLQYGLAVETIETTDQLALRQEQIADKYARLEALLLRMADVDAATHPRRASILRRAVAQCNDGHVRHQLDLLVRLLTNEDLERAVNRQKNVRQEFHALLELLLKEDRSKRLQDEQSRMRDYIKEIERLLRRQRGLQARTEGGDSAQTLAEQQQQLSQRTGDLGRQMRENEEQSSADDAETESGDGDASTDGDQPDESGRNGDPSGEQDGQPDNGDQGKQPSRDTDPNREPSQQGDGKNGSAPKDSENSPSGGEPGKNGEPQDGQNQQGKGEGQGQSQGQGGQSANPQPPAQPFGPRQRVEEARRRMEAALEKLRNEERGKATQDQQHAQEELRRALAELEEILRQTREEEIERMLALLESRFRKMLQLQVKVYEQTQQLDTTPAPQRDFEFDIQTGKLSFEQRKIVVEADLALILLQDEGSSVAFPEVVGQARDDMQQVAERLSASKAGAVTQGFEQDIIAALEEMIDALQREQKRGDEQQPRMPPPGGSPSPEQALVDMLAELRMIRSMENRIYERTKRYSGLLEDAEDLAGQADDGGELSSAIRRLGERQRRVQQITRDIVLGKNR